MARKWTVVCLAVLLLGACAGTAPNILHVEVDPSGASASSEEINDPGLARRIAFGEVTIRPLGLGSSMEAQVMIENRSSRDVVFEYRFLWYDKSGFEVSTLSSWIPAGLSGKEARGFRSTAPGPDAVSFRCMVRNLRPITDTGS
ncbi:MAG: YcfL family protein [Desulfomonilia bacterium]|jgi:uncharacterized protein YcfL